MGGRCTPAGLWLRVALLVLALPWAGFAHPAIARAEATVEVVQVGWGGVVAPDSWSPVRVRVTGAEADANATVEVILKNRYQTSPQSTAIDYPIGSYGQEVALPAGVAKDVTIWVPTMGAPVGTVRLSVGGVVVAEQGVEFRTPRSAVWPLIGVLAESQAVARGVSQVELLYQGLPVPITSASLGAADVPPTAEWLGGMAALVVQGNAAAGLTGEQRRAVYDWVIAGGDLILAGGPDGLRALGALPDGALPVTVAGSESAADLGALASWAGWEGSPPPAGPIARLRAQGGTPLVGTAAQPLVWRIGLGQGTVTVLAADPALEPLQSWPGAPHLLRRLLEPALPASGEDEKMRYIAMQQGREGAMRLQSVVEALPREAFPDARTVALILGAFALFVGPILHLGLRRADRREWVWLAVPAAALLVSGALYYVGVGREGRDVLASVVSHVRLDPDGKAARQLLAAGFFGPTHQSLAVEIPGDQPVRVNTSGASGYYYGVPVFQPGVQGEAADVEPPYRVLSGRNTRVEFTGGQWSMRTVSLGRSLGAETGRITAHLGLEQGLIKGNVRNDTPYALEDAAIVIGQNVLKIGSLAPGQIAQVVLDPRPAGAVSAYFYKGGFPLSWRLLGRPAQDSSSGAVMVAPAVSPPLSAAAAAPASLGRVTSYVTAPGVPERLELPQEPEVQRRVRLVDAAITASMNMFGPGGQSLPLTFVAFTRAAVGGDLPDAGNHPVHHLALLEQPLRLDLPPGPFTVPPALTPSEILMQTGGVGAGSDGTIQWYEVQSGSITYGFRPLLPTGARTEALVITAQQVGPSVQSADVAGGKVPPPGVSAVTAAEPGVFSVYNWQAATWEPLPTGSDQVRLQPATSYVGADGLVQVQVRAKIGYAVRFLAPEIAVEGRVEE